MWLTHATINVKLKWVEQTQVLKSYFLLVYSTGYTRITTSVIWTSSWSSSRYWRRGRHLFPRGSWGYPTSWSGGSYSTFLSISNRWFRAWPWPVASLLQTRRFKVTSVPCHPVEVTLLRFCVLFDFPCCRWTLSLTWTGSTEWCWGDSEVYIGAATLKATSQDTN